jgi:hypothetical protein
LEVLTAFRIETAEKLGRIDERLTREQIDLDTHIAEDAQEFSTLHAKIQEAEIEREVAKRAGIMAGRKWSMGTAGILVTLAEAFKAWLGLS